MLPITFWYVTIIKQETLTLNQFISLENLALPVQVTTDVTKNIQLYVTPEENSISEKLELLLMF